MGQGLTCLLSVVLFVALLVGIFVFTGRGEAKARERLATLSPDVWREGLQALLAAAPRPPPALLYVPEATEAGAAPLRLGGVPLLPPGLAWPRDAQQTPATPLLQVELAAPPLPPAWAGHRLSLFLEAGGAAAHALLEAPPLHRAPPAPPPPGARVLPGVALWPLPVEDPGTPDETQDPPQPFQRALERALFVWAERHAVSAEAALSRLLSPRAGVAVETADFHETVRVGGTPSWEQGTQPGACAQCAAPRLLVLQVGDVFGPELPLGDARVLSVVGCTREPAHPLEARLQRA